jgi:hypothetical protein
MLFTVHSKVLNERKVKLSAIKIKAQIIQNQELGGLCGCQLSSKKFSHVVNQQRSDLRSGYLQYMPELWYSAWCMQKRFIGHVKLYIILRE